MYSFDRSVFFVVSQVEVVFQGVTQGQDSESEMQYWDTAGVFTVEIFVLVFSPWTRQFWEGGFTLWQFLVERDNLFHSLSGWVRSQVLGGLVKVTRGAIAPVEKHIPWRKRSLVGSKWTTNVWQQKT